MIHEWRDAGIALDIAHPTTIEQLEGAVVRAVGTRRDSGRFVALDATVNLDSSRCSRLVTGYQSWDYAGVRPATEAGHTWWGGVVADRETGAGLAVLAATAKRLCTSIRTEPSGGGVRILALAGGAPDLVPHPPSWGFVASEATPLDLDRLVTDGGAVTAEPILVKAGTDAMTCMEELAARVGATAGARAWTGPPILGWESWYHYGFSVSPGAVTVNARLLRERFPDRFGVVQIDDGWQRSYGDWRPAEGWPDDLGQLVAEIEATGATAGLWLAPFMVAPGEPGVGAERPDLLIGHGGSAHALRDPLMGRHGLDASHPDAVAWLRALGAQVRAWGFRMVKLDFLYIGAQEGRRHDSAVTGTEALRRGLQAFVDGVGDDVYVLGCGMPYLPAVGLCHGNRVGGDLAVPRVWPFPETVPFDPDQGWLGIPPTARNVAARWWSHGRLFHNDPDVVMACGPDDGPPYSSDEANVLAALAAACGGPFFLADDLGALSPAKRRVLEDRRWLDMAWHAGARPVDLWGAVDEAERPDFYTQPTVLPAEWRVDGGVVTFDWEARHASRH